jgi:hypothetical protein
MSDLFGLGTIFSSALDSMNKDAALSAIKEANTRLTGAMHSAQGQTGQYRNDLRGQEMQAMQNRLGAFAPSRGLLASAMGSHAGMPHGTLGIPMSNAMNNPNAHVMAGAQNHLVQPQGPPGTFGMPMNPGMMNSHAMTGAQGHLFQPDPLAAARNAQVSYPQQGIVAGPPPSQTQNMLPRQPPVGTFGRM